MVLNILQKIANKLGYQLSKAQSNPLETELIDYPCINLLDLIVQNHVQKHPDFFFIQIGAHDGKSADPAADLIRRYHWKGILVEPLSTSFQELKRSYEDEPQLIFEQLAIAPEDGTTSFFQVREDIPNLPFWVSQSSSLERDRVRGALYYWRHVKKVAEIPEDLDSAIVEIKIPAMTMQSLLQKHQVQRLDFLMLGTPGFDFEILKMFPFDQIKPAIICFEYLSLHDQKSCLQFLANHGYRVGRFAVRGVAALEVPLINWTLYQYNQY